MKSYYDLLTKNVSELTYDERQQLERAEEIPPAARRACEARLSTLISEIKKMEEEKEELSNYLNGLPYVEKVPF